MIKKFKTVFFMGNTPVYGKIFKLDVDGIKSAAWEMKFWEKHSTTPNANCFIFPSKFPIEYMKDISVNDKIISCNI